MLQVAREQLAAGLHRPLRFALVHALRDTRFAAVLEPTSDNEPQTSELKADLNRSVAHQLDRARRRGDIRRDVKADDVRRLLCGIEHAVRSCDNVPARIEVYLDVLLEGLRPSR
ncbi:hypothetical protein [Marinactinospora rubrisoli]|uniref:Transcriptional regulator SbtR-like C-terminal domain-containing protein n=1 Tax=Marinactinospora rubrisoli TaxID=2715399 RepID=A0ABW2KF16_9ACTN